MNISSQLRMVKTKAKVSVNDAENNNISVVVVMFGSVLFINFCKMSL